MTKEPLQGARFNPGFGLQGFGRAGGRGEANDLIALPLRQFARGGEQGGLADPGVALNADDPIMAVKDGANGVLLALVQEAVFQPGIDLGGFHERERALLRLTHGGDGFLFARDGLKGGDIFTPHMVAVLGGDQALIGGNRLIEGQGAELADAIAVGCSAQVREVEDAGPFGQMANGVIDGFPGKAGLFALVGEFERLGNSGLKP